MIHINVNVNRIQCENLNCSTLSNKCDYGKDRSLCTKYANVPYECPKYANVPYECPKFCDLCDLYEQIKTYYDSLEFLSDIQIKKIKNTKTSLSSLGNNLISSVCIQLIIVCFVLSIFFLLD